MAIAFLLHIAPLLLYLSLSESQFTLLFSLTCWSLTHCRCALQQLIMLDRIPSSQPIGKLIILLQTNEKVLKNFQ
jgi:hypothetical protein